MISEPFATVLERHRDKLNSRFAHARRQTRNLDPENFHKHLVACVDPVVAEVASSAARGAVPEDAVETVALKLYDLALDLVGRELAGPGARFPVVNRMWRELLPLVAVSLAERPWDVPAALSNAVYNMSAEPTVDPQRWLDGMLDVVEHCASADELMHVGQIVAWQVGMAHYRDAAIAVARAQRAELRQVLFGTDEVDALEDRWTAPGDVPAGALRIVARVGGFRGFEGVFVTPPTVVQVGGRLFARDDERCWSLHADAYGATLKRAGEHVPHGRAAPLGTRWTVKGRGVERDGHRLVSPELEGASSWAATNDTLAISLRHSHHVLLVGI